MQRWMHRIARHWPIWWPRQPGAKLDKNPKTVDDPIFKGVIFSPMGIHRQDIASYSDNFSTRDLGKGQDPGSSLFLSEDVDESDVYKVYQRAIATNHSSHCAKGRQQSPRCDLVFQLNPMICERCSEFKL